MDRHLEIIESIRAALLPHGLLLRGVVHFASDGPDMAGGGRAASVVLIGNAGGAMWPAFSGWLDARGDATANPLDRWSMEIIRPLAEMLGGEAYFPSEKPWQPFQQWAMRAEGLKPSPLGILIHPEFGLWHGYRGAIGFKDKIGTATVPFDTHPCDACTDKPCLTRCPVGAVRSERFDVKACRIHLGAAVGLSGCMISGCLARNACPLGAEHRYCPEQLRFHMAALA